MRLWGRIAPESFFEKESAVAKTLWGRVSEFAEEHSVLIVFIGLFFGIPVLFFASAMVYSAIFFYWLGW